MPLKVKQQFLKRPPIKVKLIDYSCMGIQTIKICNKIAENI